MASAGRIPSVQPPAVSASPLHQKLASLSPSSSRFYETSLERTSSDDKRMHILRSLSPPGVRASATRRVQPKAADHGTGGNSYAGTGPSPANQPGSSLADDLDYVTVYPGPNDDGAAQPPLESVDENLALTAVPRSPRPVDKASR
jgi:hypothetical protein